ncbi:MAG: FAD-binding and (Fe-S)-binding domain-containing protein [Candidatus Nanopelagicales bacterium]
MRKLFDTRPDVFRPESTEPTPDRAPDALAEGGPARLHEDLVALLGSEDVVLSRVIDLVRFATDASPYRMFPQVVVVSRDIDDVRKVLAYGRRNNIPVTFRAGGTSLSGQSQGDGILVEVLRNWIGATVEDGGRRLRSKPGTVLARANAMLKPYGYRLGPDPGSKTAATIGGVVANNASGMCCGIVENSYRTVQEMTFVLPSGTVVHTGDPAAEAKFAAAEPEIAAGLMEIKAQIEGDPAVAERIRHKYRIKNTTGYNMESFLDGGSPVEILRRAMVGSEGTLGFIAEVVYETIPDDTHTLTSLMIFPDMHSAASAVAPLVGAGAAAVELLDRASIRAVHGRPGVKPEWEDLPESAAALLVEFRDETAELSAAREKLAGEILAGLTLLEPSTFTRDPKLRADYWVIRNGLLASVGAGRPSGSSFILEDVCFPPERLAEGALELQAMFARHGYDGVIFGHASAGNLHFLITPYLRGRNDIARFDAFMHDVVEQITVNFDGSLKAEHGTGRNVAPFVGAEWGPTITGHMWALKRLIDPDMVLSPGVLLTEDPQAHIKHLKTAPTIEPVADRCIECGFCEHVCPSRRVTTTPRQRIALRREMMRQPLDSPVARELYADYDYEAVETCAGDGTCAIACPVEINTGDMMKSFRVASHTGVGEAIGLSVAKGYALVETGGRIAVRTGSTVGELAGDGIVAGLTKLGRTVVDDDVLPEWLPQVRVASPGKLPGTERAGAAAVYFPACINRIFGRPSGHEGELTLPQTVVALAERAGRPVWIPGDVVGNCCGTVWHSKGFDRGNTFMANKIVESLWRWTDGAELPVVCDATSCTLGLVHEIVPYLTPENLERHKKLTVLDSIEWANSVLLPRLTVQKTVATAVIHTTCAGQHLALSDKLATVAGALAEEVTQPLYGTCCGFAGDRGMLHPELSEAATAEQAAELKGQQFDAYLCSNRTCEIGMTRAIGQDYESFLFLLEEATRYATKTLGAT